MAPSLAGSARFVQPSVTFRCSSAAYAHVRRSRDHDRGDEYFRQADHVGDAAQEHGDNAAQDRSDEPLLMAGVGMVQGWVCDQRSGALIDGGMSLAARG